jgi:uncharacterized membrane protein (UPF0127 family)
MVGRGESGVRAAWLLRDDVVLASLEVAVTRAQRRRGLLGREGIEGALLLRPCRSVHTFGMGFAIDVALCDEDLVVLRICTLRPRRLSPPRRRVRAVLEAEAGSFARWNLVPGDQLAVGPAADDLGGAPAG